MTPTDTLIVTSPAARTASHALRDNSALQGCTSIEELTNGGVAVSRNWPGLSSGEERLWSVLAWLNGHGDYPDLVDCRAHLDDGNYAAVLAAVTR